MWNKKRSHSTTDVSMHTKHKTLLYRGEEHDDICKRKKRKKLTPPRKSLTSPATSSLSSEKQEKQHIATIRETTLTKTAGLLFYAGKGFLTGLTGEIQSPPPPIDWQCRTILQSNLR